MMILARVHNELLVLVNIEHNNYYNGYKIGTDRVILINKQE